MELLTALYNFLFSYDGQTLAPVYQQQNPELNWDRYYDGVVTESVNYQDALFPTSQQTEIVRQHTESTLSNMYGMHVSNSFHDTFFE
jgi:hypothetical protein